MSVPLRRFPPVHTSSPAAPLGSPRPVRPALPRSQAYAIACLRDLPEGLLAAAVAALDVFSRRSGIRSEVGRVPLAASRRGVGPRPAGARAEAVSWRAVAEIRFGHCPGLLVAELGAARGVGAAEALARGRVALRVVPFACAADAARVAVDPEPGHLLPARPPRVGARRPE